MSRLVPAALLCTLLMVAGPAVAAGPGFSAEGIYERKGSYAQAAKIIAIDTPDQFAASFSTGTRGCGGSVGMLGKATGPKQILFTKRDDAGGLCKITVTFGPDYKTAKVSEDGCTSYHGASCDFDGDLKLTAR